MSLLGRIFGLAKPVSSSVTVAPLRLTRPTELVDHLAYITLYAPDYPAEDQQTNASAFAQAFQALEYFGSHTPTPEGREAVSQCARNLHVAFELYEKGDETGGERLVHETARMFEAARKYVNISDA